MQLGKYTEWFNDVFSPEILTMCEDILNMLSKTHGCKVVEVVIPELRQLRASHLLPVGSESLASLTPRYHDRNGIESGTIEIDFLSKTCILKTRQFIYSCGKMLLSNIPYINSLSFNPLNELLMATGSKDKTLNVFDMRNLTSELYTLQVSQ
ncbi:fatty acid amide hydrolase-like protein, partial [Tanacetum coccineum]